MKLIDYLKAIKNLLLNIQDKPELEETVKEEAIPEIIIKNSCNLFSKEEEIILKGGQMFLRDKRVDNLEEGIITFATLIRGLKYRRTDIDELGNKKIILEDIILEDTPTKTL